MANWRRRCCWRGRSPCCGGRCRCGCGIIRRPDFDTLNVEDIPVPNATLEQRMTAVENAVRELQEALRTRQPAADWLDCVIGSMKDEPAFEEVLALGRAARS